MGVELDTSGFVDDVNGEREPWVWSDLTPFTQAYVEALFDEVYHQIKTALSPEASAVFVDKLSDPPAPNAALIKAAKRYEEAIRRQKLGGVFPVPVLFERPAFSDLAPEALSRIIEDCEKAPGSQRAAIAQSPSEIADAKGAGAEFWSMRQRSILPAFPPLTPYLDEDGKVRFQTQGSPS